MPSARSPAGASTGTRRSGGRRRRTRPRRTSRACSSASRRCSSPDEVHTWLAEAVTGWVGRVGAARLDGRGAFVLETISGELPDELEWAERGGRAWVPFSQAAAETLLELRGARLDQRALRCAMRLQVGQEPAGATLSLVDSVGEPRFTLDVNWDPDTDPGLPHAARVRGARPLAAARPVPDRAAGALPPHLRRRGRRRGAGAARHAPRRARRRDRRRPPLARARRAARRRPRSGWAASCAPSSARASRTCSGRGGRSSPTSRASARPCRRSPRSRRTTPGPRS